MSGRYLLDTNIVIRLFSGDKALLNWLKQELEVYIPSIVLGELFYGAQKSTNMDWRNCKTARFIPRVGRSTLFRNRRYIHNRNQHIMLLDLQRHDQIATVCKNTKP